MSSGRPFRKSGESEKRELLRAQLFAQQQGLCHLCGTPMTITRRSRNTTVASTFATFDHLVPRSEGGTSYWKNLKLAHRRCNSARNSRPLEQVKTSCVDVVDLRDVDSTPPF